MSNIKSPFVYIHNALADAVCDEIVLELSMLHPDTNEHGIPQKTAINHDDTIERVSFAIERALIDACKHYGSEFSHIESMDIEWVPAGANINGHCENSELISGKWVKTRNRDFTCVLFLSSSGHELDDTDSDCFGGKLQFINYGFGFLPQLGDMVFFPSDARFSNSTSRVHDGDLVQIRIHVTSEVPYYHDISRFSGTYRDWF